MWETLRPVRTCQLDSIFTQAAEQQPSVWYEVHEARWRRPTRLSETRWCRGCSDLQAIGAQPLHVTLISCSFILSEAAPDVYASPESFCGSDEHDDLFKDMRMRYLVCAWGETFLQTRWNHRTAAEWKSEILRCLIPFHTWQNLLDTH